MTYAEARASWPSSAATSSTTPCSSQMRRSAGGAASVTKWLISEMWPMRTGADRPYFELSATRIARRLLSTIFRDTFTAVGLFDTHIAVALAHCLFNVPLAVWILEGFMSGVPRELDELAFIDGHSFPQFFRKFLLPSIASGIGVAAFFCFMFSWVELLLAKTLTSVDAKPIAATMTRTASTSGYELGLLAAAGALTIVPGAFVIYFVRNYIAKGFSLGRV